MIEPTGSGIVFADKPLPARETFVTSKGNDYKDFKVTEDGQSAKDMRMATIKKFSGNNVCVTPFKDVIIAVRQV
jgi:hypothetical protein